VKDWNWEGIVSLIFVACGAAALLILAIKA
jgi:hypothetical protein